MATRQPEGHTHDTGTNVVDRTICGAVLLTFPFICRNTMTQDSLQKEESSVAYGSRGGCRLYGAFPCSPGF